MDPRGESTEKQARIASILVLLMLATSLSSLVQPVSADGDEQARDASIRVTITPNGQTVNPGEAGEYTVIVRNMGSNPVSVSLASSEEQGGDCGAYSSTIGQIPTPIDAGQTGETTMNVTLTQTAEGSCDTTVTASATEQTTPPDPPGAPAQENVTITTTAGDGSGSAIFGVDLKMDPSSKNWNSEDTITYNLEVENTGQTNETVALTVEEDLAPGCSNAAGLTVTLSETTVQIDTNDTEYVTVSVDVPEGQEAEKYCWEITGTVTNDPTQNASDTQTFDLTIPELRKCTMTLSKTSITVDPGAEGTFSATLFNDGNVGWDVTMGKSGAKASWVTFDGASSGLLPYDDGNGMKTFDFKVSPDDSLSAGDEAVIAIQGKDGTTEKCSKDIRVIVGQSHGASLNLVNSLLPSVQPGDNASTTITVTNQGNGVDTLKLSTSSPPPGWRVSLESATVTVQSKHDSGKSADVGITVDVPHDALATEDVEIVIGVMPSSGGAAYAEVTLRVTVAELHGMEASSVATDQTGRSQTQVRFPISIDNMGNVDDTFRCVVMSQTSSPAWDYFFEDADGNQFVEIVVPAQSTSDVFLVVSIDGEEELASTRLTVRVTNKDDPNSQDADEDGIPDNQRELQFLAILSNRNFQMDVRLEDGGLDGRQGTATLPPGGELVFPLWVKNTGDGTDSAVFEMTGLEGVATRTLYYKGMPVDGELTIPAGYGIWNFTRGEFVLDGAGNAITASTKSVTENKMFDLELIHGHEARPFEQYMELKVVVSPGADTGDGGLLQFVVYSSSNAANRSGTFSVSLSVQVVYELDFDTQYLETDFNLSYGSRSEVGLELMNTGNIRTEVRVFASENLRGWDVSISSEDGDCRKDGFDMLCWVDVDSSLAVNLTIRPPHGAELEDVYKFTLSAEPVEIGKIGRENIEFQVTGQPDSSMFGFLADESVMFGLVGLVVLLGVGWLIRPHKD